MEGKDLLLVPGKLAGAACGIAFGIVAIFTAHRDSAIFVRQTVTTLPPPTHAALHSTSQSVVDPPHFTLARHIVNNRTIIPATSPRDTNTSSPDLVAFRGWIPVIFNDG